PTGMTITYQPGAINFADGMPFTQTVSKNPVAAIGHGTRLTIDTLLLTRNEIFGWFAGNGPQFMGPVGIAKATGDVAAAAPDTQRAISPLLELAALLSINLGIINLLPLPALDGGRILFVGIELLRGGKRVDPKQESLVHFFGFAAFILLVIVITWRDITQIISG
ncbi:MAG: site-2 protease family protein, partial [Pseudomonadales bacterium]|nr:site-2 protease family protein [Pseudomonadales bacterium]